MKTEHAEDVGPLDDAALVTAAQHDRAAYGSLYERYVDPIYRYLYHQVGNHVDAEDLTTRTFQHARATLPEFDPGSLPFDTWLAAIARELVAEHRGGQAITGATDTGTVLWPTHQPPEASELVSALRRLPLEQQRAIVLKFARGRTNQDIAGALKLSETEGIQLMRRALIALRAALESK